MKTRKREKLLWRWNFSTNMILIAFAALCINALVFTVLDGWGSETSMIENFIDRILYLAMIIGVALQLEVIHTIFDWWMLNKFISNGDDKETDAPSEG